MGAAEQMPGLVVMVIDDDAADRKQIHRLLTRMPMECEVVEVADGAKLAEVTAPKVDLVLLDHLLPGISGLDLIDVLQERWPRAGVCVVTGQGDETVAKNAIQRGAVDYVPKRSLSENVLERIIENGCKVARMRWEIEEQRQDMGVFSEVLVHDLKAPIRSTLFLIEKLAEDISAQDTKEVERDMRLIAQTAERMSDLVASLAGHVQLDRDSEPKFCAPRELADQAVSLLLAAVEKSGAQITVEADDVPLVLCHGPQIVQLLQNLINNAIKYAGDSAPCIHVHCTKVGRRLQFSVSDNGIGVPEQYKERVFQPFKRLPVAASIPGTGLGLATCRKIVDRHNGRIWCEPNVPQGTVFRFELPLGKSASAHGA